MLLVGLLLVGCGGGGSGGGADGAVAGDGGRADAANLIDGGGGGSDIGPSGNPSGSCQAGVPARAQRVDTSNPTTVVGTGTAASCTFSSLQAAVAAGGIITFDCGPGVVTIPVTSTLDLPIDQDTTIDGGRTIVLDGGGTTQVLRFDSPNFQALETTVTLQDLEVVNGKTTPVDAIPSPRPAPCSQGFNDGEGGGLYMRDGNLNVIGCIFRNNHAAPLGPDTGGGAIYVLGSKHGVVIAGSTFEHNDASNAAAVGGLFAELDVYDSLFDQNTAVGHDANNNDPSKCSFMNNGQNEIGSGGNGGAIYSDGASVDLTLCGDRIADNAAGQNAFGGGLFFTSNDFGGDLTITDTVMTGNTGGHWTQVATGSTNNAGTAVGTNAHSLTIVDSMLQGVP
jgi:hypothetical protein